MGDERVLAVARGRQARPVATPLFALVSLVLLAAFAVLLVRALPPGGADVPAALVGVGGVLVSGWFVAALVRSLVRGPTFVVVTPTRLLAGRGRKAAEVPLARLTGEVGFTRRGGLWVGVDLSERAALADAGMDGSRVYLVGRDGFARSARHPRRPAPPGPHGVALHRAEGAREAATALALARGGQAPEAAPPWDAPQTRGRATDTGTVALGLAFVGAVLALMGMLTALSWWGGDRAVALVMLLCFDVPLAYALAANVAHLARAGGVSWAPHALGLVARRGGETRLVPWRLLARSVTVTPDCTVELRRADVPAGLSIRVPLVRDARALAQGIRDAGGAALETA